MNNRSLDSEDDEEVHDHGRLRPDLVYEVVRREGLAELERPFRSLAWSGVAAGLAMSFSVVGEAMIARRLPPDADWAALVSGIGYTFGFLIVIVSRLQLFTEHTMTALLPITYEATGKNIARLARLWGIVLAANTLGAIAAAWFIIGSGVLSAEGVSAVLEIGRHLTDASFLAVVAQGVGAGFLVAALVWMLPSAGAAQVGLIVLVTWLIAIAGFAHIIAGTVEIAALVIAGQNGILEVVVSFWLPALIGNMIGGAGLFTMLAYGQVQDEI